MQDLESAEVYNYIYSPIFYPLANVISGESEALAYAIGSSEPSMRHFCRGILQTFGDNSWEVLPRADYFLCHHGACEV